MSLLPVSCDHRSDIGDPELRSSFTRPSLNGRHASRDRFRNKLQDRSLATIQCTRKVHVRVAGALSGSELHVQPGRGTLMVRLLARFPAFHGSLVRDCPSREVRASVSVQTSQSCAQLFVIIPGRKWRSRNAFSPQLWLTKQHFFNGA